MRKKGLIIALALSALMMTSCSVLPFGNNKSDVEETTKKSRKNKDKDEKDDEDKINDGLELVDKTEKVKDFIKEYELEGEDGEYSADSPDVDIEVDGDGYLTLMTLRSKGLKISGVKVGDDFDEDKLDKKLKKFTQEDKYTTDRSRYYTSSKFENEWFVYITSDKDEKVDEILLGLTTNGNLKTVEKSANKFGTSVAESSIQETTQETTTAAETTQETQPAVQPTIVQPTIVQPTIIQPTIVVQPTYIYPSGYVGDTGTYILPESSTRYLSAAEINALTPDIARFALNEVYARHGRRFNDTTLQQYFDAQPWYVGTVAPNDFKESWLNEIEKANIQKLNQRREGKTVN